MFCISLCVTGRELTDTEGEMAFFFLQDLGWLWSQWSLITKEEELIMISNRFLQDMPFIQFKNKNSCAAALLFVLFGVCSPILCPADRHSSWVCAVCYMKEVKQLILCNNDKNCIKLCKKRQTWALGTSNYFKFCLCHIVIVITSCSLPLSSYRPPK